MPTDDAATPIRKVGKLEAARLKKKTAIRISCEAGIDAVLADELVVASLELLDAVSAALLASARGEPESPIRGQVLRSVGSIAANIAEGIGKGYEDDGRRFYLMARGSAYESVIWLRALAKHDLVDDCTNLCRRIDAAILKSLDTDEEVSS